MCLAINVVALESVALPVQLLAGAMKEPV
jgi:hypothetical protein